MLSSRARIWSYTEAVRRVQKLSGLIVEVGVAGGASFNTMVRAQAWYGRGKGHCVGYDLAPGFPNLNEQLDGPVDASIGRELGGYGGADQFSRRGLSLSAVLSEAHACELPLPAVTLVEGNVTQTLLRFIEEYTAIYGVPPEIRLLSLDVDNFEPTFAALCALGPLLVPGALVILDQAGWGERPWPGETLAMKKYFKGRLPKIQRGPWPEGGGAPWRQPGGYFVMTRGDRRYMRSAKAPKLPPVRDLTSPYIVVSSEPRLQQPSTEDDREIQAINAFETRRIYPTGQSDVRDWKADWRDHHQLPDPEVLPSLGWELSERSGQFEKGPFGVLPLLSATNQARSVERAKHLFQIHQLMGGIALVGTGVRTSFLDYVDAMACTHPFEITPRIFCFDTDWGGPELHAQRARLKDALQAIASDLDIPMRNRPMVEFYPGALNSALPSFLSKYLELNPQQSALTLKLLVFDRAQPPDVAQAMVELSPHLATGGKIACEAGSDDELKAMGAVIEQFLPHAHFQWSAKGGFHLAELTVSPSIASKLRRLPGQMNNMVVAKHRAETDSLDQYLLELLLRYPSSLEATKGLPRPSATFLITKAGHYLKTRCLPSPLFEECMVLAQERLFQLLEEGLLEIVFIDDQGREWSSAPEDILWLSPGYRLTDKGKKALDELSRKFTSKTFEPMAAELLNIPLPFRHQVFSQSFRIGQWRHTDGAVHSGD